MPAPRNRELRGVERREKVAAMYLRGLSQREIGTALNCSQGTISKDLNTIRAEWLQSSLRNFDEAKALELARIDKVEAEAWAAWERSQKDAVQVKEKGGLLGTTEIPAMEREVTTKGQCGDPRFLTVVQDCIKKRSEILGLDAPKTINQNHNVQPPLTRDQMKQTIMERLSLLNQN